MRCVSLRVGALPLLLAVLVLGGCSDAEPGLASPEGSQRSVGALAESSAPAATSSGSVSSGIDSVEPCSLLTDGELSEFADYEDPESRFSAGARNCRWTPIREKAQQRLPLINLDARDNVGIDGMPDLGTGLQRGRMDGSGREVVQTTRPDEGCIIGMAVGEAARVDVVVGTVETDKACDIASRIAEMIDPKLPMG